MRKNILIILFCIILLLNINFAFSEKIEFSDDQITLVDMTGNSAIHNSSPTFIFDFTESDEVVTVIQSSFYSVNSLSPTDKVVEDDQHLTNYDVAVQYLNHGSELKLYPFSNDPDKPAYLLDGFYRMWADVEDKDGNRKRIILNIEIQVGGLSIWVNSPQNPFIADDQDQYMAYSKVEPFTLTLETFAESECRISYSLNVQNLSQAFLNSKQMLESGNNKLHQVRVVYNEDITDTFPQLEVNEIDYSSLDSYLVICKLINTPEEDYFSNRIYVGIDETPPEIDFSFFPSLISNPADISTTPYLDTYGDKVICNYTFTQNPLRHFGYTNSFFQHPRSTIPDVLHISDYDNPAIIPIFDFEKGIGDFPSNESLLYNVSATCYNLANWKVNADAQFELFLDRSMTLTQDTIYFNTNTQDHYFYTNIDSLLFYREYLDSGEWIQAQSEGTEHYIETEEDEGEYDLVLRAESNQAKPLQKTFNFVVDMTKPDKVNITSKKIFCFDDDEDDISVKIEPLNDDIAYYNYVLKRGRDEIFYDSNSATSSQVEVSNITENETFVWTINAVDLAYNEGDDVSITMTAKDADSVLCDFDDPVITTDIKHVGSGKSVYINCTDNVGCTNSFSFGFGTNGICDDSNYNINKNIAYVGNSNPVLIRNTTTLCIKAEDRNGNVAFYNKEIKINLKCYNGVKDVGEEGIDCGGVCEANCAEIQQKNNKTCLTTQDCSSGFVCLSRECVPIQAQTNLTENETCSRNSQCQEGLKCLDGVCSSNFTSCSSNLDCDENQECNYLGVCVDSVDEDEDEDEVDLDIEPKGSLENLIPLGISILGIFMITGGVYLIYSHRRKGVQAQTQQNFANDEESLKQQEMLRKQRAEQERRALQERLEKLRKGKEKQKVVLDERKQGRKEILSTFEDPNSPKEESFEKQIPKTQEIPEEKEKLQERSKPSLQTDDEGFVDLSEFKEEKTSEKKEDSAFSKLKKILESKEDKK